MLDGCWVPFVSSAIERSRMFLWKRRQVERGKQEGRENGKRRHKERAKSKEEMQSKNQKKEEMEGGATDKEESEIMKTERCSMQTAV